MTTTTVNENSKKKTISKTLAAGLLALMMTLPFVSYLTLIIIMNEKYNLSCGDYITRAAQANTVETALAEINPAIAYAEKRHMTEGYTSVVYNTPDEDIGFWYHKLATSRDTLLSLPVTSAPEERAVVLLKFNQSINVVPPSGISQYPANIELFLWGWISAIIMTFYVVRWVVIAFNEDDEKFKAKYNY